MKQIAIFCIATSLTLTGMLYSQDAKSEKPAGSSESVKASNGNQLILWTSGDREAALKMVFMYSYNCKRRAWMDTVRIIVWGPSAKLLAGDSGLQAELKNLKDAGVELFACKACVDLYGVGDKLSELGVTVMYAGQMLADLQKRGWHVLTL